MSEETEKVEAPPPEAEQQRRRVPICPYCKADPLIPDFTKFQAGPFELHFIWCSACRMFLSSIVTGMAKPMIQQPNAPRVIVPA